ncbi:hypothetical protein EDO6_05799 [Paenibacillus xylanexedens]|nr:hypothetical protein EDO6_05799 [Paenibacillus xylanexedens]
MSSSIQQHSPIHTEEEHSSTSKRFGLLLAGIIVIAATMRSPITATGPVVEMIRSDTGIGHTMVGLLTSLPLLAFAAVSPFAPRLAKRLGLESALLLAVMIVTIGVALRLLPSVLSLYAGTAILGCGIALSNVLLPSLIKRDFPLRVGIVTGLYSVSMNIFGAIASGVSVPVAGATSMGWHASLGMWALLSILALLLWLPQIAAGRQRMLFIATQSEGTPVRLRTSSLAWFITLFMGLQSLIFYTTITWLPEILAEQGFSPTSAGWMLSLMQMVSVPATFIVPNPRWPNARSACSNRDNVLFFNCRVCFIVNWYRFARYHWCHVGRNRCWSFIWNGNHVLRPSHKRCQTSCQPVRDGSVLRIYACCSGTSTVRHAS